LDSLDKYSGSPVPRAADKGKPLKRTSSGPAVADSSSAHRDGREKRPKLDVQTNVLAENLNKPAGPIPPPDFETQEQRINDEISGARQRLQYLTRRDPYFQQPGTFNTIDECNRVIGRQQIALNELKARRTEWISKHGALPNVDETSQLQNRLASVTTLINTLATKLQDIYSRARTAGGKTQAASKALLEEANHYSREYQRRVDEKLDLSRHIAALQPAPFQAQAPRAGPSGVNRPHPLHKALSDGGYGDSSSSAASSPEASAAAQAALELGGAALGGGAGSDDIMYGGLDRFSGNQEELHALLQQAAEGSDFEGAIGV
jgi:hypothetical protein